MLKPFLLKDILNINLGFDLRSPTQALTCFIGSISTWSRYTTQGKFDTKYNVLRPPCEQNASHEVLQVLLFPLSSQELQLIATLACNQSNKAKIRPTVMAVVPIFVLGMTKRKKLIQW